jgi:hypothetical protein
MNQLGKLVDASKVGSMPAATPPTAAAFPGSCRVILLDPQNPRYTPKVARNVGLFRLNPEGVQFTASFRGHEMEGDIVLSIGDVVVQVPCEIQTDALRLALQTAGITATDCRVTVFPGLWEFDFNGGKWKAAAPSIELIPFEPPEDDETTPIFSGQITLISEAWLSVTNDGRTVATVPARDWVQHDPNAIRTGAIGGAVWSHEAGYLVLAWQCRDFSFRVRY